MAEALLREVGGDRFNVMSAGAKPCGYIHPLAIGAMERLGVSLNGQRSKGGEEFADAKVDIAITLCDAAAKDACPTWTGATSFIDWSMPDPAGFNGTDGQRLDFAVLVAKRLKAKMAALVMLDFKRNTPEALRGEIELLREL